MIHPTGTTPLYRAMGMESDMNNTDAILVYLHTHLGNTAIDVANAYPVESKVYGRQRAASSRVAALRKAGYIEDVERCSHCGGALTRGTRNVPLFLTPKGEQRVKELRGE